MAGVDFLEKNDNYVNDAKELIIDQFKGSSNINKILNVVIDVAQEYENIIVESAQAVLFENAIGDQVDEMGRQMGVVRRVEDDAEYKAVIALKTVRRSNDGTRDTIYNNLVQNVSESVQFVQGLDNQLDINLINPCSDDANVINEILDLLPINTRYRIVSLQTPHFGFGDDDTGYGTTADETVGGKIGSQITAIKD